MKEISSYDEIRSDNLNALFDAKARGELANHVERLANDCAILLTTAGESVEEATESTRQLVDDFKAAGPQDRIRHALELVTINAQLRSRLQEDARYTIEIDGSPVLVANIPG